MIVSLPELADRLASYDFGPEMSAADISGPPSSFSLEFFSRSLEETDRIGEILAAVLRPGTVVALNGTLGAGKTRLVQAIAAVLGVPPETVTSPTFVLIQEYRGGKMPIFHFDAYRLRDEDEFLQLGPEEYFDADGVSFVEWAERVSVCLPWRRWEIFIEHHGAEERKFTLRVR